MSVELSVDALLNDLRNGEWQLRQEATRQLQQIQDPDVLPTLLEAAEDEDLSVRTAVISTLGNFEDPGVIAALEHALFDDDWEVQWAAMRSLGQIYKEPLLRQMGDRLPEKRIGGIQGLSKKPMDSFSKALCAALEDESETVQIASVQALIKLQVTEAIPYLEQRLPRCSRGLQAWIAEALVMLGKPSPRKDEQGRALHTLPCQICQHLLAPSELYWTQIWNEPPKQLCRFHFEEYQEKIEPFEGKFKLCKLCQIHWPKYEYVDSYCPNCREQRYRAMPMVEDPDQFRCYRCHKLHTHRHLSPVSSAQEPTCSRCAHAIATLTPKPPFYSDHAIHFLSEAFENGYFLCEQSRLFLPLAELGDGEDFRDLCLSKDFVKSRPNTLERTHRNDP